MNRSRFILTFASLAYADARASEIPPDPKNADEAPAECGRVNILQFASSGSISVTGFISNGSTVTPWLGQ